MKQPLSEKRPQQPAVRRCPENPANASIRCPAKLTAPHPFFPHHARTLAALFPRSE
jgi:hypothetical protein